MSRNRGRTSQAPVRRRSKLRIVWNEIIWPGLIISCIGLASILFLVFCARVSVLELQARSLDRQIDKQTATQRQLWHRVAALRDRARLREFADHTNMVFEPEATDTVQLPALPQQQWTISPLTPHPEAVAIRPDPAGPEPLGSGHRVVVADSF